MRLLPILAFLCCLPAWLSHGAVPAGPAELPPLARDGKEQFEKDEYARAERIYRKMLAQAPNILYAQSNLDVVLFRANRLQQAEEALKNAIVIAPEDGFSHCTLGTIYDSEDLDDRSVPQGRIDRNPLVMRVADTSGASPGIPPATQAQANEARQAFEKGDYQKAEAIYREMLKTSPDNLSVLSNLGVVLFRQKKLKEAEDCFTKAIAIEPVDGFAHCTLGIVYYTQGKYDAAISELHKAIAVDGKNATAHNYLGATWSQKGHQDEAQREFETAIALDPNYADADYNLAVLLATKSSPDMEKARQYYQQARKLGAEADPALERLMGQKGVSNAPLGATPSVVRYHWNAHWFR